MSFPIIAGGEQIAHYQFIQQAKALYEIRETAPFSTPVKSFIFDFGGVLVKPDEELLIAYLSDFFAVSPDEIRKLQVKELEWIRVNDTEFSFWQNYANQLGQELPADWRDEYAKVKFESVRELPQIGELLEEVQREGYNLVMLSNFEPWMEPLLDRFEYRERFKLYLSYQTKRAKPSSDAYEAVS